jgi:hypothetical protein
MKMQTSGRRTLGTIARGCTAFVCIALLVPGDVTMLAQAPPPADSAQPAAPPIPPDQLDSLVAPIALYPDPLLAQVLAASTYPLEIIQLQQWLSKHKDLKDQALVTAVEKEDWDPSIQAMAGLPDVVKRLADDIKWTTDLGNAFLEQESDVMDAVQRMRQKAQSAGNLKSGEQQKVETKVVESKQVIVIEQANPQVVYVPTYNPVVVYGPPVYPYPPIYYPPPGYYAAGLAISFGVGVAMGAFWGGGWGWGCGWGHSNNVNININNNFNRNYNRNTNINGGNRASTLPSGGNRGGGNGGNRASTLPSGGNNWQHNPQHRGGAPYGNRDTAQRFGGTTRGDSVANRQASARQNQGQIANRGQNTSRLGGQSPSAGTRPAGGAGASTRPVGGAGANRPSGGGDRVGNRNVSPSPSPGNRGGAFNGASSGMGGGATRASSQRGASSMGGGGAARSGGGARRR